jgi:diguanylate cyclase (GGDEF)-like protein
LGSLGTALITARGGIADVWSITVGNAILAAAYGILWSGVRRFNGRRASIAAVLAGAAVWTFACQIDPFYESARSRIALMATIIVAYSLVSAVELWRDRSEGLLSRWPVIVLLLTHAAIYLIRIPLAGSLPLERETARFDWSTLLVLETILQAFCVAYMFGSLARERIALRYQQAALTDPLTGVANRRAFMTQAERVLRRARFDGAPVALLLFDIDRFKRINDTYGHSVGDQVLIAFCQIMTAGLRPTDLFGRLGGEEFAGLLADTPLPDALAGAERFRTTFARIPFEAGGREFTATVSIGVAMVSAQTDLAAALAAADRALYRAKTNGRNRLETADASPAPAPALSAAQTRRYAGSQS